MKSHRLAPLALSLLLVACAGRPVQTTQDQKILRDTLASGSALVTAGCVTRNQFGDDLLLTEASARMAEQIRTQSLAHLATAGVRPVASAAVLVCPGHTTGESPGYVVKANRDTELTLPAQYPIALDAAIQNDAALAAAYDALFRAVVLVAKPASGASDDVRQPKALALTPRDLELIRRHAGAERLWVVNGGTSMVSFAKSFGTAFATGLATTLTFGIGYFTVPQNGSAYQLDLVDLGSGQRLWRGQLAGPAIADLSGERGTPKPQQLGEWADALFAPLIASAKTTVEPAATPTVRTTAAPVAAPKPAAAAPAVPLVAVAPASVAAVAAPAVGQTRTLTRAASLRPLPKPDGAPAAALAAGSTVRLTGKTLSPTGLWWYAVANGRTGWIADAELAP